jgi:hypothetical protein
MKKSLVVHIIVIVISVALGSILASSLAGRQMSIAKSRDELSKSPLGGFNKFASDVQWMLFINYCGSINSVKEENVDEIYNRLNTILRNDPDFVKAYNIGGMMLSVRAPVKSAEILMRGANNPNLKNNWKLPFLAGYVLSHNVKDKDDPKRLKKAEEMFRLAVQRGNPPEHHVVSSLLRTRAKRIAKKGKSNGIPIVNAKHAYLCAWFDEWRKSNKGREGFSSASVGISDMNERILKAAQEAKASEPGNKDILKTVDKVIGKVLANQHLCLECLSQYNAGDKFCSSCGLKVAVYGICGKCGTVMKGKHCSACGHVNKTK